MLPDVVDNDGADVRRCRRRCRRQEASTRSTLPFDIVDGSVAAVSARDCAGRARGNHGREHKNLAFVDRAGRLFVAEVVRAGRPFVFLNVLLVVLGLSTVRISPYSA